jgi:hypothetical protein
MVMIQTKPAHITPHAEKILRVVQNGEQIAHDYSQAFDAAVTGGYYNPMPKGWLNRSMIAWAIGKRRLIPYDIAVLNNLVEQGLIEVQQPAHLIQQIGYWYQYHSTWSRE